MRSHESAHLYLNDRLTLLHAEQQHSSDRRDAMLDRLRRLERMHSHLSLNPAHAERCNNLMGRMLEAHADLHVLDQRILRLRLATRALCHEVSSATI
jgi:hypothetical protein